MEVEVNYKNSGVHTLKGLAGILSFIGVLAVGCGIFSAVIDLKEEAMYICLSSGIFSIILSIICLALSTITETALFKRVLMEREHTFVEVKDKKQ